MTPTERKNETMVDKASLGLEIIELKKQLEHERNERKAAQRTIARLGGGIDEEIKTFICANTKCLARAPMIRANQRYCSSRCKLTAAKRRQRQKEVDALRRVKSAGGKS